MFVQCTILLIEVCLKSIPRVRKQQTARHMTCELSSTGRLSPAQQVLSVENVLKCCSLASESPFSAKQAHIQAHSTAGKNECKYDLHTPTHTHEEFMMQIHPMKKICPNLKEVVRPFTILLYKAGGLTRGHWIHDP